MAATIASAVQSITRPLARAIRRVLPRSWAAAAAILLTVFLFASDRQASAADAAAVARPWIVQELKGAAFSRPGDAGDEQWLALRTGERIEPGSVVRTDGSGRIEMSNGLDRIRLSPNSEIELPVALHGDPVTRVIHWIGTAFFQVGKRPAPQFEVDTPYIVAIVKGTKFTTTVSDAGASIKVSEGIVGVSAATGGPSIDVTAGGSASASAEDSGTVTPGPSGDAAPAGTRGKESTLARSRDDPPAADGDIEAAGSVLGGSADDAGGGTTASSGRRGGNGNGRGRDEGNDVVVRNGDGQGGVDDADDDDNGGGCHHGGHGHGHDGHGDNGHGHGHDGHGHGRGHDGHRY
jgi:hypothetical protein